MGNLLVTLFAFAPALKTNLMPIDSIKIGPKCFYVVKQNFRLIIL